MKLIIPEDLKSLIKSKGFTKENYDLDDVRNWLFEKHNLFLEIRIGTIGNYGDDEVEIIFDVHVYNTLKVEEDYDSNSEYDTYQNTLIYGIRRALNLI